MKYTTLIIACVALLAVGASAKTKAQCDAENPARNLASNCVSHQRYNTYDCKYTKEGGSYESGCTRGGCVRNDPYTHCSGWWIFRSCSLRYRCSRWQHSCTVRTKNNYNGNCNKCSSNYYLSGGKCHKCSNDYYCNGTHRYAKQACPAGQERLGAEGNNAGTCKACGQGLAKSSSGNWKSRCAYCNVHTYEVNRKSCSACPSGCSCHSGRKFCSKEDLHHLAKLAAMETHKQKVELQQQLNSHKIKQSQLSQLQANLQTDNQNLKTSISNAESNRDTCRIQDQKIVSSNNGKTSLLAGLLTANRNLNDDNQRSSASLKAQQNKNARVENDVAICTSSVTSLQLTIKTGSDKMHKAGAAAIEEGADFVERYELHSRRYLENAIEKVDVKVSEFIDSLALINRKCYYDANSINKYDNLLKTTSAQMQQFNTYSQVDVASHYVRAKEMVNMCSLHIKNIREDNARAPIEQKAAKDTMDKIAVTEKKIDETMKKIEKFAPMVKDHVNTMRGDLNKINAKPESERRTSTLTATVEGKIQALKAQKPCTREIDAVACKWAGAKEKRVFVSHHKQLCAHDGSKCTCKPSK